MRKLQAILTMCIFPFAVLLAFFWIFCKKMWLFGGEWAWKEYKRYMKNILLVVVKVWEE